MWKIRVTSIKLTSHLHIQREKINRLDKRIVRFDVLCHYVMNIHSHTILVLPGQPRKFQSSPGVTPSGQHPNVVWEQSINIT